LQYRVPYVTTVAGARALVEAIRAPHTPAVHSVQEIYLEPHGGRGVNRRPLTKIGAGRLRDELKELKTEARPKIIRAIAEARAHGDLRENAEYHAAKEQQGFIEGRIAEIEGWLGTAEIIDPGAIDGGERVVFGATVELERLSTGTEVRYQIVGDVEADIGKGLISISSPLARALIGKEEGEIVIVVAPDGEIEYEILSVAYR